MPTIALEPLRWQEQPSRVAICQNGEQLTSFLQVTAPCNVASLCKGRPAEELPRILSILSPAHHLVSALALDGLFDVTPPPLAQHMRVCLKESLAFKHHLKKLFFLLSSFEEPFTPVRGPRHQSRGSVVPKHLLEEMMHAVAMAQEAASILGGRSDHPLSAVVGGVSRNLKEAHLNRLTELADFCSEYVKRLRDLLHQSLLTKETMLNGFADFAVTPVASLALDADGGSVVAIDGSGKETARFSSARALEALALHSESWTYRPFVYLKDKGWSNFAADNPGGLVMVGPLARLNRNVQMDTPLAEEERQLMVDTLGPFPHYGVQAAYWSLLVELIQTAEKMKNLFTAESLSESDIRVIPLSMNPEASAAMEAPEGFIFHKYLVDEQGIVKEAKIIDAATANNGFQMHLSRLAVAHAVAHHKSWEDAKRIVEISLMPF